MIATDYYKMGEVFAKKSVIDEILTLRNRTLGRLGLAEENDDFEGKIFFRARLALLDNLLQILDPTYAPREG